MNDILNYRLITPKHWVDYELIDSGNFEKLERFGKYILCRPEPQAIWNKTLLPEEWEKKYDARFVIDVKNSNGEKGKWFKKKNMPEEWIISYNNAGVNLKFLLKFNTFKHIGIFPEQADNWDFIFNNIKNNYNADHSVLNLFAYTGGASLAARAAGAKVVHVDSVRPVVQWSKENMQLSNLDNIHWIVDDALKFAQREERRGNKYNGIILDPPAFGRGPDGEKWILEKHLNEIIYICSRLLKNKNSFFILNLYSLGFSALISENVIKSHFPESNPDFGELFLNDKFSKKLPLGTYIRFNN
ncbi:MAG: class I SAM-dependent methyltransferase [Bacteroidales bacterium]|jgi:23S rRNA (cytosine1962-C5)-methyltransferase|nr:class I SAM-dependent methyltransferase [Bacteroidales bacterium]